MFNKSLFGTEFALGAGVALVTFTVLYALVAGVSIDPLTMPGSIPIELVAGMVGVVIIIVAALWWANREPDQPSVDEPPSETPLDEGSSGEQQPEGPTEEEAESGSESVSTARNANLNNDGVTSDDSSSARQSDASSRRESTDRRSEDSRGQRRTRDGRHQGSRSRDRAGATPSTPEADTDDTSEVSDEYRRELLAESDSGNRSRDE